MSLPISVLYRRRSRSRSLPQSGARHWLSVDANEILGSLCRLAVHDVSSGGQRLACLAIPSWARGESIAVYPLGDGTASTPWRLGLQVAIEGESLKGGPLASGWRLDTRWKDTGDRSRWLEKSEIRGALMGVSQPKFEARTVAGMDRPKPSRSSDSTTMPVGDRRHGPFLVIGGEGSGATDLAKAIYYQRRRRQQRLAAKGTILPVECRLMDRLLMQEIIELANERDANEAQADTDPPSLLLIDLTLLPAEVHVLLADTLSRHPSRVHYATTSVIDLSRLYPRAHPGNHRRRARYRSSFDPFAGAPPRGYRELTEYYLEQCRGNSPTFPRERSVKAVASGFKLIPGQGTIGAIRGASIRLSTSRAKH